MEWEPAACQYLVDHADIDLEYDDSDAPIYENLCDHYWIPRLAGTDYHQWCEELRKDFLYPQWFPTMSGDGSMSDRTLYEMCNSRAVPLKFSVVLPFSARMRRYEDGDTRKLRIETIKHVTSMFQVNAQAISGVSVWFTDLEYLYGVWPTFALPHTQLRTLVDLLAPALAPGALEHYQINYARVKFPLFPVPCCQFVGIMDHNGEPLEYQSRTQAPLKHLHHNGGYNRQLPTTDLDEVNASLVEGWHKFFACMRLTDLTGCTKPNSAHALRDPCFGTVFKAAQLRLQRALHPPVPVPAPPPPGERVRLNFDPAEPDDYYDPYYAVGQLQAIAASLEDPLDHKPVMDRLNKWFLVERYGGQVTLWQKSLENQRFMRDPGNAHYYLTLAKSSIADVRGRLDNIQLDVERNGKLVKRNAVDVWLAHAECNTVHEVVINIQPSSPEPVDPYSAPLMFNNWRGFDFYRKGHYAKQHALHGTKAFHELYELPAVKAINSLVYGVLCNGDTTAFRAVTCVLANVLQLPNDPPKKCIIMRGAEGVGKSLLTKELVKRVFGFEHSAVFSDPNMIVGNFNSPLSGKTFAVCEEAFFGGDKEGCGRLQQAITGEWQLINEKFQVVRIEWNHLTFWMNSNKDFVAMINKDGRRYIVNEVNDIATKLTPAQKIHFFADLVKYIEGDGLFEYAYFLARIDLQEEWMEKRAQVIVHNQALALQKAKSLNTNSPVHAWLDDCFYQGYIGREMLRDEKGVQHEKVYEFARSYDFQGLKKHFDAWRGRRGYGIQMADFIKTLSDIMDNEPEYVAHFDQPLDFSHKNYVGDFPYLYMPSRQKVHDALCQSVTGLGQALDTKKRRKVMDAVRLKQDPVHVNDLLPDATELEGKSIFEFLFGDKERIKI